MTHTVPQPVRNAVSGAETGLPERIRTTPPALCLEQGAIGNTFGEGESSEPPGRRILVAEDTPELAALLAEHLKTLARDVCIVGDGRTALTACQREKFDLLVLDIGLPALSGLEVCRALRTAEIGTPILMLTARASDLDRIVGLEFGADDYMVKPFNVLELLARAKAIFRRTEVFRQRPPADRRIEVDHLHIIPDARQVLRDGQALSLTETEFDLLYLLASYPGRVYSRGQLLAHVWGHGSNIYEYTVTSHINRLRAKIETDPGHPKIILTVWGVGYRLHTERSC